ncbi:uncharacterized protein MELLADRAFT_106113 [Melampsora larici-populina 98AG31]|uniref:Uncharacterized protein n=1 Tax=Melampsora larici-populina (strain 98AG31 / pathotype 3-4-7) TaxID=747676 RepID=F4RKF7_MELLP|nr:uncharacterized protein MELLADRAFT_106113 [Melampsora larici-populina 98AG31]EGG07190.1 hypothetical protein MELLADRAFT_106113 [Melampsora larici-populina 98AG31]
MCWFLDNQAGTDGVAPVASTSYKPNYYQNKGVKYTPKAVVRDENPTTLETKTIPTECQPSGTGDVGLSDLEEEGDEESSDSAGEVSEEENERERKKIPLPLNQRKIFTIPVTNTWPAPVSCVPWVRCVAKRCSAEPVAHIGAQALHTVALHCAARTNAVPATPRRSSRPPVVRRDTNMCAPLPDSRRALPTRNPICTPKSNTTSVVSSPSTVRASKTNKRKRLGPEAEKGQQEPSSDATISKEMEVNLAQDSDNEVSQEDRAKKLKATMTDEDQVELLAYYDKPLHGKEDVITGTLPTIDEECEDEVAIVIDDTESVDSEILTLAPSNAVEDHDEEEIPEEAAEIEYDADAEDALDLEDAKLDRLEDEELKGAALDVVLVVNLADIFMKYISRQATGTLLRKSTLSSRKAKLEAEKLQAQSIDISTSEPDSTGLDSAPSVPGS